MHTFLLSIFIVEGKSLTGHAAYYSALHCNSQFCKLEGTSNSLCNQILIANVEHKFWIVQLGHLAEHTIQAVSSPELDDDEKERNPP